MYPLDLRCVLRRLSTNRRHGFLCLRTASMEHAADTAEAAAVDHYFSSPAENVFVLVNQSINQYSFITARQDTGQQLEAKRQYS